MTWNEHLIRENLLCDNGSMFQKATMLRNDFWVLWAGLEFIDVFKDREDIYTSEIREITR